MSGLPVGAEAPPFELRDQHGQGHGLASLLASGPGLVVFFPWAFTPVCGSELHALRDRAGELERAGLSLVAISCDPMSTLRAFDDTAQVGFPLLSDFWPHGAVASDYGAFDSEIGCARRSSYLIDADRVVRHAVHSPMGRARDIDEYLRAAAQL